MGVKVKRAMVDSCERHVIVRAKSRPTPGAVALDVADSEDRPLPAWIPGAHVELEIREGMCRQYSLCGDPSNLSHYTIAVKRGQSSRGESLSIHDDIRVGDRLRMRGPRNSFELMPAAHYVFIAGDIGIAPIVPMIDGVDHRGVDWQLHYGDSDPSAMTFGDELRRRYPDRVHLYPRGCARMPFERIAATSPAQSGVYACGPARMLDEIESAYADYLPGLSGVHIDRFRANADDNDYANHFDVVAARSGVAARVSDNQSVLNALRSAGVTVPSSCEQGICGTCETRVLGGTPDHRDDFLTDDEKAQGETMIVCVSGCKSDRLILDL